MHSPESLRAQMPRGEGVAGRCVSQQGLGNNRLSEFPEVPRPSPSLADGHHPHRSQLSDRQFTSQAARTFSHRAVLSHRRALSADMARPSPSPSAGGTETAGLGSCGWQDLSIFSLRAAAQVVATAVHLHASIGRLVPAGMPCGSWGAIFSSLCLSLQECTVP